MSKRNIQDLARILASKYDEANIILEDIGLELADTMLSPEEQKTFARKKASVDGLLSMLSIGLSAAAQGKIDELLKQVTTEYNAFAEPLRNLIDNLADPEIPAEQKDSSEQLIKLYNDKIRELSVTLGHLGIIKFYANLVRNKKKQRRYFREKFCRACDSQDCANALVCRSLKDQQQTVYSCYSPFTQLDAALSGLRSYVSQLGEATAEIFVDDLSE